MFVAVGQEVAIVMATERVSLKHQKIISKNKDKQALKCFRKALNSPCFQASLARHLRIILDKQSTREHSVERWKSSV